MRNTADVTGGKPIAVLLQSISVVSAINPLVAFHDIHGGKREVLFFYFVPDTTRDNYYYPIFIQTIRLKFTAFETWPSTRQFLFLFTTVEVGNSDSPAFKTKFGCNHPINCQKCIRMEAEKLLAWQKF
jgi:hypothetical protein